MNNVYTFNIIIIIVSVINVWIEIECEIGFMVGMSHEY